MKDWGRRTVRVRFVPAGVTVEVPVGRRLYDVAGALGLPLAQACEGEGICGRCGLVVCSGAAALSPESAREAYRKRANRVKPAVRLACLTRVAKATDEEVVLTTTYW